MRIALCQRQARLRNQDDHSSLLGKELEERMFLEGISLNRKHTERLQERHLELMQHIEKCIDRFGFDSVIIEA